MDLITKETCEFPVPEGGDAILAYSTDKDYRSVKAFSNSWMKPLIDGKSFQHCNEGLKVTDSLKTSLEIGSGFDALCHDLFYALANGDSVIAEQTDWRSQRHFSEQIAIKPKEFMGKIAKKNEEAYAEWQMLNMHKTIITETNFLKVLEMIKSVATNKKWAEYLSGSIWQPCFYWWEEGLPMKAKLDHVVMKEGKLIPVEIKTSSVVTEDGFSDKAFKLSYDLQLVHYETALKQYYKNEKIGVFRFLVCENQPPYESSYFFADEEMYDSGKKKRSYVIRKIKEHLSKGTPLTKYPKSEETKRLVPPPYSRKFLDSLETLNA